MHDSSISMRFGHTSAEGSMWISTSSLRCIGSRSTFKTRILMVTSGGLSGSFSMFFSADLPTSSIIIMSNSYSTGSSSFSIHGSGFGFISLTALNQAGHSTAESTSWHSDTCMVSRRPSGLQATQRVAISFGSRVGSGSEALSQDLRRSSAIKSLNSASTGSSSLTIFGLNLGQTQYCISSRIHQSSCEISEWRSDSSVACRAFQAIGSSHRLVVSSGDRIESSSRAMSMSGSLLSSVRPVNGALTGASVIVLHGTNLGYAVYTSEFAAG